MYACNHHHSDLTDEQLSEYILNPADNDSLCIEEIERAKRDLSNGRLVFSVPFYFGSFDLRQEHQVKALCKINNIVFDYEPISDAVIVGQTQGCYGAYMDKKITEKFGKNFKVTLLAQADSILVASNDTIKYYLCDKRPQMPGEKDNYIALEANLNEKLSRQIKTNKDGHSPFMDIGFYIDEDGRPSGYFLNDFYDADHRSNETFKDDLFEVAVELLEQYQYWEPGQVIGQKVVTENNVRVFFLSERKGSR